MDLSLSRIKVRLPGSNQLLFQIHEMKIASGTHMLIHGPSGKGKTTLLHLLAGLFTPQDGSVFLGELNLAKLSDAERSHVRRRHYALVFQKLNLLEHLTAVENVLLGEPAWTPGSIASAQQALKRVHMHEKADQLSATMSLGEQQRVAVARVLVRTPEIILADEPTSSLDAANAEAVIEALLAAAEGRTLLVVSHDERIRRYFQRDLDFRDLVTQ